MSAQFLDTREVKLTNSTNSHSKLKQKHMWFFVFFTCAFWFRLRRRRKTKWRRNTQSCWKTETQAKTSEIYLKLTMKKELGDCTRRFSLCFLLSNSTGGCSKSISFESTCAHDDDDPIPMTISQPTKTFIASPRLHSTSHTNHLHKPILPQEETSTSLSQS